MNLLYFLPLLISSFTTKADQTYIINSNGVQVIIDCVLINDSTFFAARIDNNSNEAIFIDGYYWEGGRFGYNQNIILNFGSAITSNNHLYLVPDKTLSLIKVEKGETMTGELKYLSNNDKLNITFGLDYILAKNIKIKIRNKQEIKLNSSCYNKYMQRVTCTVTINPSLWDDN